MSRKLKTLTFFLALALSVPFAFASCSKKEPVRPTPAGTNASTAGSTEAPAREAPALPAADYDGYEFRILMRDNSNFYVDFFPEETSTSPVDQAVWERNETVRAKYNFDLKLLKAASAEASSERRNIMSGDDYYDLVAPHGRSASKYAAEGLGRNLYDIPNLSLDFDWWSQLANEAFTINEVLFFTTGDLSHTSSACAYGMLFNIEALNAQGISLPYENVRENTWDWETFEMMVRQAGQDLNGDGKYELKVDRYAYLTHQWAGPVQAFYSSNNRILTTNDDGVTSLSGATESAYNALDKFFKLMTLDTCYLGDQANYWSMLNNGLFFFADATLLDLTVDLKSSVVDYGIVPFPKIDTTMDHYACNVAGGGNLFLVPTTIADWNQGGKERTGVILESLCREGNRIVRPAFFNKVVSQQSMRTADNYEMLSYITDGRLYDMGYYHMALGDMSQFVYYLAVKGSADTFYSDYAGYETSAQENLSNLIRAYNRAKKKQ